ncbi:hypothetical protein HPG69_011464 [Diceros bicornis minor]|uniref:Uncharacterized protein n=1 Tax=Diceros bicornis minor TaxID=77932 RepID=A0A7J7FE44_DICBM|nr:hypothetical protein HPG69_011464 [Diceros bicornis minor]
MLLGSLPDLYQKRALITLSVNDVPFRASFRPVFLLNDDLRQGLINNTRANYFVEDYIQCEAADFPAVVKTRKKPKEWVPEITVPEPFRLIVREQNKKEKNMKSQSEIEVKHIGLVYLQVTSKKYKSKPVSYNCNPPMPMISSRGREPATGSSEEKKTLKEERNRMLTKQKQRMKELQKLLTTQAKVYDSYQSLAQMSTSKVKSLRKSKKEKMKEYQREL